MSFQDIPADRESQTHSFCLSVSKKRLVQPPENRFRQPFSGIPDNDRQAPLAMEDGFLEDYFDLPAFGHGFQRIHEQIDQDLLEGTPCSSQWGEPFGGFDAECRVVFPEAFLKEGVDVMEQFLQMNRLEIKGPRLEFFQMRPQKFIDAPGFVGYEPDLSLNFRRECVRV